MTSRIDRKELSAFLYLLFLVKLIPRQTRQDTNITARHWTNDDENAIF